MTPVNLIRDYLGMQKVEEYNETTLNLLAGCADQTKDGYVEFLHSNCYIDESCHKLSYI